MADFSLEHSAEQIVDSRTRAYFREVYSSYANGNYRSAVVMLWSVVVCDLLFKLEDLRSRGDPEADKILKDVRDEQLKNPKAPAWEDLLLTKIKEKTNLFDVTEHTNLVHLHEHRHLSAHPILTTNYELFAPNQETTRAHIRNVLEAVLTKPAFMSKRIFDAFTEDLERYGNQYPLTQSLADPELQRYLDETFLRGLSLPVTASLFRSLWRVVFKSQDERAKRNASILSRALRVLYRKHRTFLIEQIKSDPNYFSSLSLDAAVVTSLVDFLAEYPEPFTFLTDEATVPLKNHLESDTSSAAIAWFVKGDMKSHLSMLAMEPSKLPREAIPRLFQLATEHGDRNRMLDLLVERHVASTSYGPDRAFDDLQPYLGNLSPEQLLRLFEGILPREAIPRLFQLATEFGISDRMLDLLVRRYVASTSYDGADRAFDDLQPYLANLSPEQFVRLFEGIEKNSETHKRRRAHRDHRLLRTVAVSKLASDFDFTPYPEMKSAS